MSRPPSAPSRRHGKRLANDVPPARKRPPQRRQEILEAALHLFRRHGYHAVGIDDIGAAVGISGPAVYRHFANKEELLVSALDAAVVQLWPEIDASADAQVEHFVARHVDFAVDNADVLALWYQEWRNLPAPARRRQRRIQRRYVQAWTTALLRSRPELAPERAEAMVRGAIGLVHSVADYSATMPAAELRPLLADMAGRSLQA
ncbi:MAG TPA: helix-turn-helix domain-containing protein [Acidimicrobiales bacterium]|nr:helix-turn-helix domain-containing protein [Acidimicrobiales bacterium]